MIRKINYKRFVALILTGAMTLFPVGCSKKDTTTQATTESAIESTASSTDATTEVTTESATEAVLVDSTEFDINNDASIDKRAEEFTEKYSDYLDGHGIDKDQVVDMILFINNKFIDDQNKPLFTPSDVTKAEENIKSICGMADESQILQVTDNLNTMYYSDGSEEQDSISQEVAEDNARFVIQTHPKLSELVDTKIAGGEVTEAQLIKFEEFRDTYIEKISNGEIDVDFVNDYVIKENFERYNDGTTNINSVNGDGQTYIFAVTNASPLNIAAKVNINCIYIPGYEAIGENTQINLTPEAQDLQSTILELEMHGEEVPEEYILQNNENIHKLRIEDYYDLMCTTDDSILKMIDYYNGIESSSILNKNPKRVLVLKPTTMES